MNEKILESLKGDINQTITVISNLEMDEEQENGKLKNLKLKVGMLETIEKMELEQQKINNLRSENDRKLTNEENKIKNDFDVRMAEIDFKREELQFKGKQLEQDMQQFELDCETRIKEAKWGALWHGIGEVLGISRFMLWRHDRRNMYKSECVIQHKEMNVVTPTQKEINKEYADLIRKEIK